MAIEDPFGHDQSAGTSNEELEQESLWYADVVESKDLRKDRVLTNGRVVRLQGGG
jgi:hypothetical protein